MAVPVLDQAPANVVVPQPLSDRDGVVAIANVGNNRAMVLPIARGAFSENMKEIADGAVITGFEMMSTLCCKADTGMVISVDDAMGVAEMSEVESLKSTATVRALRAGVDVELCDFVLLVTPDPTVTSHLVPATRVGVLVAAVNVRVAVNVPDPDDVAAANVVVPH